MFKTLDGESSLLGAELTFRPVNPSRRSSGARFCVYQRQDLLSCLEQGKPDLRRAEQNREWRGIYGSVTMFRQHVLPWTFRGRSFCVLYYRYQGGLLEASETKGGCGQENRRRSRPEEPHKLMNIQREACPLFVFTHSFTQKLTS